MPASQADIVNSFEQTVKAIQDNPNYSTLVCAYEAAIKLAAFVGSKCPRLPDIKYASFVRNPGVFSGEVQEFVTDCYNRALLSVMRKQVA